jgi:hypothetical protein
MFDTKRETATPELTKKLKANTRKWKTVDKYLLSGGCMLRSCDICSKVHEPHLRHCTPEEQSNHKKAMAKLSKWAGEEEEV